MKHCISLDVSLKSTSLCIVDVVVYIVNEMYKAGLEVEKMAWFKCLVEGAPANSVICSSLVLRIGNSRMGK